MIFLIVALALIFCGFLTRHSIAALIGIVLFCYAVLRLFVPGFWN